MKIVMKVTLPTAIAIRDAIRNFHYTDGGDCYTSIREGNGWTTHWTTGGSATCSLEKRNRASASFFLPVSPFARELACLVDLSGSVRSVRARRSPNRGSSAPSPGRRRRATTPNHPCRQIRRIRARPRRSAFS